MIKSVGAAGLSFLIMCAAGAFLANQGRTLWLSLSDPFTYDSVDAARVIPSTIKSGAPIALTYAFTRHRYCSVDLNLFVARDDESREIVWRSRQIGGATLLGHIVVKNVFDLPPLAPGRYFFRTISVSNCSDGPHVFAAPDVPFVIE